MGRAHFYWGCAVGIVLGVVLRSALPLDESVPRFTEERSLVGGGGSASTPLRFVPPQPRSVAAAGSSAAPLVRLALCQSSAAFGTQLAFDPASQTIRSAALGVCVVVDDGLALRTASCAEVAPARFRVMGDEKLLVHEESGQCLDALGGKDVLGLYECNGRSANQLWVVDEQRIHLRSRSKKCVAFDVAATLTQLRDGMRRERAARAAPSAPSRSALGGPKKKRAAATWASSEQPHTVFRWSDLKPPTAMEVAPLETLRASRLNVGDVQLLRQFLRRIKSGRCGRVLIIGGSISAGHGVGGTHNAYPTLFVKWLNAAFPCKNAAGARDRHTVVNRAVSATGSNFWFSKVAQFRTTPFDLILVELGVNDIDEGCRLGWKQDQAKFSGMGAVPKCAIGVYSEALVRNLLRLPSHPAIIYFETGAISRGFDALFPSAEGGGGGTFVRGLPWGFPAAIGNEASREHFTVCQYYGVPVVSVLDALYPSVVRASSTKKQPWAPPAMDWIRAQCDGSSVLAAERKSVGWCQRTGRRNRDPKHLSLEGHRFATQLLINTMLDEMERLESFVEPIVVVNLSHVKTVYLEKYHLELWEDQPVETIDLTIPLAPSRAERNSGWELTEDVKGKPGHIATKPKAHIALKLTARRFVMIGYLVSYRNIGRARAWFDDDRAHSIVLDGLVKERVSILHHTELSVKSSAKSTDKSSGDAAAPHTLHIELENVGSKDAPRTNKFKLLEVVAY